MRRAAFLPMVWRRFPVYGHSWVQFRDAGNRMIECCGDGVDASTAVATLDYSDVVTLHAMLGEWISAQEGK